MLLILSRLCFCITLYDLNGIGSKSFDDGTDRPIQHNNNDEASYRFGFKVNAFKTGDIKEHIESRQRDEVKGAYFLVEPNGYGVRYVQYVANDNGFNAVVRQQYGTNYSKNFKNFGANEAIQRNSSRQELHTNDLNESKVKKDEKLSQKQETAFNRFQHKPIEKYTQQNIEYRQSSPKSITNQSSILLVKNFRVISPKMLNTKTTGIPSNQAIGIGRQYEVIDPEVDIDMRRSISKPFLNLNKLKRARRQE